MTNFSNFWTRRGWLAHNTMGIAVLTAQRSIPHRLGTRSIDAAMAARLASQSNQLDPTPFQALAQQAVDAARGAGAHYTDARLTRTVGHHYVFDSAGNQILWNDTELVGVGVRALVDGYWGFAACPWREVDAVVQVARDAVAQAKMNANGPPRAVEMGKYPVAQGTWMTPVRTDPFQIPLEEKFDFMAFWADCAQLNGLHIETPFGGSLTFVRQERVVATSDNALFTQTVYESQGKIKIIGLNNRAGYIQGLENTGQGWEVVLDANIPAQLESMPAKIQEHATLSATAKPFTVGRYTLVCDGATMAALLNATLGIATQLDRALGYEANAGGTSFLDDPLGMVGEFAVAAPMVTVTANRTERTQLATVKWDDEGVETQPFTLIKEGVLTDFQTTREQATWLAPYYAKHGRPVRSNGCAASEGGLVTPLEMMPNLSLEPGPASLRLEDLIADVQQGILIEWDPESSGIETDFQARNGLLSGQYRSIDNGRLGKRLNGGAVLFNALNLWKNVIAVAGSSSLGNVSSPDSEPYFMYGGQGAASDSSKGEPPQATSHSVRGVAATIVNQSMIDPTRKA